MAAPAWNLGRPMNELQRSFRREAGAELDPAAQQAALAKITAEGNAKRLQGQILFYGGGAAVAAGIGALVGGRKHRGMGALVGGAAGLAAVGALVAFHK